MKKVHRWKLSLKIETYPCKYCDHHTYICNLVLQIMCVLAWIDKKVHRRKLQFKSRNSKLNQWLQIVWLWSKVFQSQKSKKRHEMGKNHRRKYKHLIELPRIGIWRKFIEENCHSKLEIVSTLLYQFQLFLKSISLNQFHLINYIQ